MPNRKPGLRFPVFSWLHNKVHGKPALVVEVAQTGDLTPLSEIHHAGFSNGWSDGELEKMLAGPGYSCLVARREGGGTKPPLGFVIIRSVLDEAEVITIAVNPGARRGGIARYLMEESIRRLQSDRIKTLFLEVAEGNEAAKSLYAGLGFSQISDRRGYYPSKGTGETTAANALVMKRDLG